MMSLPREHSGNHRHIILYVYGMVETVMGGLCGMVAVSNRTFSLCGKICFEVIKVLLEQLNGT